MVPLLQAVVGRNFFARNWIGAIADYSEAIRLSPGSADFYIERGHVYIVAKGVDAAIADLTEAIRLTPQSYQAYNERGLAYFRKGDLVRAQEDITAALARFPAPVFYANRGDVYEAQGRNGMPLTTSNLRCWAIHLWFTSGMR
jgi:tetratricopeptide (TPR) repeat protein